MRRGRPRPRGAGYKARDQTRAIRYPTVPLASGPLVQAALARPIKEVFCMDAVPACRRLRPPGTNWRSVSSYGLPTTHSCVTSTDRESCRARRARSRHRAWPRAHRLRRWIR
jgi:hypothetical protein